MSPAYARLLACTGLCSRVGLNAQEACEEDVRAGGDATSDDLAGCLFEGVHAEKEAVLSSCGQKTATV